MIYLLLRPNLDKICDIIQKKSMYDELYNEYFIFSLLFSGRRGSLREVFRFSVVETQSQVSRLNLEPQLGLLLTAGQDRQIRIWSSVSRGCVSSF